MRPQGLLAAQQVTQKGRAQGTHTAAQQTFSTARAWPAVLKLTNCVSAEQASHAVPDEADALQVWISGNLLPYLITQTLATGVNPVKSLKAQAGQMPI